MNAAWGEMSRNPCGADTWTASKKMKDMVTKCSQLRYGEQYTESYKALKLDQDTWCGGPKCSPACSAGVKCRRELVFPFEPKCDSYPRPAGIPCDTDRLAAERASWYVQYGS